MAPTAGELGLQDFRSTCYRRILGRSIVDLDGGSRERESTKSKVMFPWRNVLPASSFSTAKNSMKRKKKSQELEAVIAIIGKRIMDRKGFSKASFSHWPLFSLAVVLFLPDSLPR